MSAPRRIGVTGNGFSSLQRAQDRSARVVYSNTLTQQTRVQNGLASFIVYQGGSVGQGGPVNGFSLSQGPAGAINLTVAERDAAIAAGGGGGGGGGGSSLTFNSVSNPIASPYTVPAGYTSMYLRIIAGGGGCGGPDTCIGGGGSGSLVYGTVSISAGAVLNVTCGTGGVAASDGTNTIIEVNSTVIANAGAGHAGTSGANPGNYAGAKGLPQVVGSLSYSFGNDGQNVNTGGAPVDGVHGGGGTNGINSGTGHNGYYEITLS